MLFAGSKTEGLGHGFAQAAKYETPTYLEDSQRFLAMKLTRQEGDVHVTLFAMSAYRDDDGWKVKKGDTILLAHVTVSKPMEKKLMKVPGGRNGDHDF